MKRTIIVIVIAFTVLLAGCGGPGDTADNGTNETTGEGAGAGAGDDGAGAGEESGGNDTGGASIDDGVNAHVTAPVGG